MPTVRKPRKLKPLAPRFSIAEWYGTPLTTLTLEDRRRFAELQSLKKKERPTIDCPFDIGPCWKDSGVCSLRLYEREPDTGVVVPSTGELGGLRTTCPSRFEEDKTVYKWVGETILGYSDPVILGEIGFLESPPVEDVAPSDVGRIDKVLVVPNSNPLSWCALEAQSVYFQGRAMSNDYAAILNHEGEGVPFPPVLRRPDYRSSGPKRLMPQLQIKVPSLRRWGKKVAVVIDRNFFMAMGKMRTVPHLSSCDVAWFVVRYEETPKGHFKLVPHELILTTLEDSVEGLTAGVPISLNSFEQRIVAKLQGLPSPVELPSN